ncbi:peroxisomal membrane protein import receptor PEX19 [Kluyveromyces marxianus]|uniref:Peroxisomal membrane protein import receptor PEX19 n=2 Tax=Kluyveromyces marxianus TaxID=4911 RepID=W0TGJ1_KLUMD|nr:peroxisomal membrane protein import receptor PEX19 [Kluyveromyces marxianus DMKU3-1042]QGN18050.1 peroxisomal membrane protein import receptor PEX19 [Kluyveromyces marxianus]BAO41911.1 peroxisomal membrane protein import receptor PEX19 [Kluyveromyces marxianus DMKU3-1042]
MKSQKVGHEKEPLKHRRCETLNWILAGTMDEFDDLDDYLEDPSKLDTTEDANSKDQVKSNGPGHKGPEPLGNNDDPEVAEMMEDLQKQFEQLMQDGGEGADQEMVKNFESLLNVLGDASKEKEQKSSNIKKVQDELKNSEGDGFKSIISNTLDRLKESSTKVDETLEEEKKSQNSDDILSQLLDQLVANGDSLDGSGEEGMDNAILKMLSQMSSKEVLYQPMKQMQVEFTEWLKVNEVNPDPEHSDKIDDYRKQYLLINKIIGIYESSDYTNEKYHSEIADLLDELEQLGDSPVAKGFNNSEAGNDMSELAKLLEIQGDDNIGEIDKDLEDTCKQQ